MQTELWYISFPFKTQSFDSSLVFGWIHFKFLVLVPCTIQQTCLHSHFGHRSSTSVLVLIHNITVTWTGYFGGSWNSSIMAAAQIWSLEGLKATITYGGYWWLPTCSILISRKNGLVICKKGAQCHQRVWSGAYFGVMRLSDKWHWCILMAEQFIQARVFCAGHFG